MESVIERIEKGRFWKFHGGIHPPEMKFLTTDKPIRPLAIPPELIIPIQQHIGEAGEIIVQVNDLVLKGQALTRSTSPLSVPVHAPTSGKVIAIEESTIAHPSGLQELCIKLAPDNEDTWCERQATPQYQELTKYQIIEKIAQAGIAGMGGAGFPTHIKVNSTNQINYLIINAAECEPYITADDLLIREHCAAIVDGIKILDHLLEPAFILIGIEDNKPEAIQTLQKATQEIDKIKVCVLPTKYPTGGEKQLIQALTGQEVPVGVIPSSLGIVMQNVATCFAISDAVIFDTPLIKRVVTVSGQALDKPQNVWALLGTPIEFLLSQCGYPQQQKKHIVMGGPMMGFSLPNTHVPVVKTTNCILAPSEQEIPNKNQEVECIRCGQCAEVCPSQLLPQELQWSAKAKDHQQLDELNLFDCIECGACAYVCPSHIPLVHYYRVAKAEIRQQKLLDIKAENAKQRFEARKARLEREKIAREEKHKAAAAARKARMNSGTPEANSEKSAVAAALARVKAKKAQANQENSTTATATATATAKAMINDETSTQEEINKKSQVSAAIARAKAKKLAAEQAQKNSMSVTIEEKSTEQPAPLAANSQAGNVEVITDIDTEANAADDKKAKIAAAVAKAKARKKAASTLIENDNTNETQHESTDSSENHQSSFIKEKSDDEKNVDEKQARIAAAVAKAKAKKNNQSNTEQSPLTSNEEQASVPLTKPAPNQANLKAAKEKTESQVDAAAEKKARIAAAVAKAKAKKQQAESK